MERVSKQGMGRAAASFRSDSPPNPPLRWGAPHPSGAPLQLRVRSGCKLVPQVRSWRASDFVGCYLLATTAGLPTGQVVRGMGPHWSGRSRLPSSCTPGDPRGPGIQRFECWCCAWDQDDTSACSASADQARYHPSTIRCIALRAPKGCSSAPLRVTDDHNDAPATSCLADKHRLVSRGTGVGVADSFGFRTLRP